MTTAVEHRFGPYGGQYVPETLMPALAELEAAWVEARDDAGYRDEVRRLATDFCGRPTPLYHAERRRSKIPLIASGGLTPENVAEAIAALDPYAVDVASGVEAEPGIKDPDKVAAFIAAADGGPKAPAPGGRPSESLVEEPAP